MSFHRLSHALALSFIAVASACSSAAGSSGPGDDDGGATPDDTQTADTASPTDDGGATDTAGDTKTTSDSSPPPPVDGGPGVDSTVPAGPLSLVVLPDDGKYVVLNAIKAATKSIHVEVYLMTDTDVSDALIGAKKAGRDVSVLLEKSPYPDPTANKPAFDALTAGGVKVAYTTGLYPLTHSKFMVLDAATVYVMTLNLTASGVRYNREYAAIDTDATDVAEAEQIFAADLAGTAKPKLTGGLVVSPVNARTTLTTLIDSATKTLDLEFEELSDTNAIGRLEAAVARGVVVRVIVPAGPDSSTAAALPGLKSKGVLVKTLTTPELHAKAIVADGARLYVGSINLTKASIDYNREVGIETSNAAAVARAATTLASDFAKGTAF